MSLKRIGRKYKRISYSVNRVLGFDELSRYSARAKNKKLIFLTYAATLVLVFMVIGMFVSLVFLAILSRSLPDPNTLLERSYQLSTKLYDRNGKLMFEVFGEKNRTLVPLDEISPYVIQATLAAEDSEFYLHKGFSVRGMARALRNTLFGAGLQGGSTITQQVIKNTLLTQERTIWRKIKEFVLSLQLENRYTKEEIIQMYLNETPYGGMNYGVYSASKAYFNKDPKDLTLAESAFIAGLPQRPSYYSPYSATPEAGLERKDYVLYLMKERGWVEAGGKRHFISSEEYEAAKVQELKFETAKVAFKAPHFIFYTKQILADMFGDDVVEQGGLKVTTSLDLDVQKMAEDIVKEEVEKAKNLNVWNGAMVVIDPKTSQILAMVGSKDYNADPAPDGCVPGSPDTNGCKFDPYVNVTLSNRQPGSAIKPITYATLLSQGYTAAQPFLDVPTKFKGSAPDKPYEPENYDGKFRGPMSLRKSLGNSLNIPAVKALDMVGLNNMIDMAEKMGITTFGDRSRYGLALTLGGGETKLLELTGAFSVFAAKGTYRRPTPIVEVKNANDEVIYKWSDTGGAKVLSEEVAFLISDILSDDGARSEVFGAGSLLKIPNRQVAVKTGTTDDKRDNYAIGFTPSVVVGVWVGNNNNEKMNPYVASGITGATPIWSRFMREYLADKPIDKFEAPKTMVKVNVDEISGGLPVDDFPSRPEWFIKGTEPTTKSDWFSHLLICEEDGNIANSSCKDSGETDEKTFIKIKAELPKWQSSVDSWVNEHYSGKDEYFPPTITTILEFDGDNVKNEDSIYAKIVGLNDGDTVNLDFRLNVEVSTGKDIDKVKIYMDGQKIAEDSSKPYGYSFSLKPTDIGEHTFKIIATNKAGKSSEDEVKLNVEGYAL